MQNAGTRKNLDPLESRQIGGVVSQTLGQPRPDRLPQHRVQRHEARPAFVRYLAETLLQNQAAVRVETIGAAAERLARQLHVIGGRVVAAQTQPEPTPTAGYSVTGARVATGDVERGDELLAEADRLWFVEVGDDDGNARGGRPGVDDQHGAA